MRSRRPRASSTVGARRLERYRRPANSIGPSRSRRSVLHLVQELRGICSNRSSVAWGAPLIRWSNDGAIVLAARPIASLLAGLPPAGMAASLAALVRPCVARGFVNLADTVLHQCIRSLIGACAPGHHGYQRACDLLSG